MKKFDCVVAVGCSYLIGANIMDSNKEAIGEENCMSKFLSDKLNCDNINLSRPAGSNERIFRKIHQWVESNNKYKTPLIVIGLSGLTRTQIYSVENKRYWDFHPFDWPIKHEERYNEMLEKRTKKFFGEYANPKDLETFTEVYTKYLWDEEVEITKLERNCLFLDGYLKQRNIDYLLFNSIEDNISNIKDQINYVSFNVDTNSTEGYRRNDINGAMNNTLRLHDCWYHYLRIKHTEKYDFHDTSTRSALPPHGEFFCGSHPSPKANKDLTELIYKHL